MTKNLANRMKQLASYIHKTAFIMDEYRVDKDCGYIEEEDGLPYSCDDFLDFDYTFFWSIKVDVLKQRKDQLPALYSVYKKCGNKEITRINQSLLGNWYDDQKISDDEFYSAIEDCELDCLKRLFGEIDDFNEL